MDTFKEIIAFVANITEIIMFVAAVMKYFNII